MWRGRPARENLNKRYGDSLSANRLECPDSKVFLWMRDTLAFKSAVDCLSSRAMALRSCSFAESSSGALEDSPAVPSLLDPPRLLAIPRSCRLPLHSQTARNIDGERPYSTKGAVRMGENAAGSAAGI
jgi:hypothetical protein